jgi:hypothetical protein
MPNKRPAPSAQRPAPSAQRRAPSAQRPAPAAQRPAKPPQPRVRRGIVALLAGTTIVALAILVLSLRKAPVAERAVPPQSVGKTLVSSSSAFREGMSIGIPREIAIEPRFGKGAAEAFAASLGRDVLAADVLRSVSPAVASMQDALVLRVNDSPISEQYNVDAPVDMGMRANNSLLSTPGYQRARRYWRHYLRIEPADPSAQEWRTAPGDNEVDESTTSARVVRTPGWQAMIARREVVAVDAMRWEGDALSISYRWRWVPTIIGAPFVSADTAATDHVAANSTDAPLLSSSRRRGTLVFVKTEDGGWAVRGTPVATNATAAQNP